MIKKLILFIFRLTLNKALQIYINEASIRIVLNIHYVQPLNHF